MSALHILIPKYISLPLRNEQDLRIFIPSILRLLPSFLHRFDPNTGTMYTGLLHLHSALRWVALILMIATIIDSLIRMYRPFKENERKLALFSLISLHTQLIIGALLYFVSPIISTAIEQGHVMKNPIGRFYLVEHLLGMLIAIVLVTVGYSKAKKQSEHWSKHRIIFFYYLVAFILILISIPWPFRLVGEGRGWF